MGRTTNLKRSRPDEDEDVSSDEEVAKSSKKTNKKTKTSAPENSGKDGDGNSWWGLGGTRRVTISEFKGKNYVNIREYYLDNNSGQAKPGKKGIMLNLEQYNALLESIPAINAELQSKGHETPNISSTAPAAPESPEKASAKEKRKSRDKKKANIEATSEEDEETG